jgi:RNA polymerase sigma factor (sigma-70 family)
MEIALTRAPVVEHDALVAWLHAVIRREALDIARARRREEPTHEDELRDSLEADPTVESVSVQAMAEWRERYRVVQDALAGLTDSQRVCLMLMSTGISMNEIERATGFSERKIERSVREGRMRLRAWELRVSSGMECDRMGNLIDLVTENAADRGERKRLSRHVRHCARCRAAFHGRRDQLRLMSSLVPAALIAPDLIAARPPDVTFAVNWWERLSNAWTVRAGQSVHLMLELPTLASSKAAAGAIAAAAAGTFGTPLVIQAVRSPATEPIATLRPAPVATAPVAPPPTAAKPKAVTPAPKAVSKPATRPQRLPASTPRRVRTALAPRTRTVVTRAPARSTTYRLPARTAPLPPRPSTPKTSPALEFGP